MSSEELKKEVDKHIGGEVADSGKDEFIDLDGNNNKDLSDFEKQQVELGWDPNGVKSAEEWQRHFGLTNTIKRLGEDNKELKKTLKEVKSFMERQMNKDLEKDDLEFKKMKQDAIKLGDHELVNRIEKASIDYRKAHEPKKRVAEFDDFTEKYFDIINAIDGDELDIKLYLNQVDTAISNKGLTPKQHVDKLEAAIQRKFPSYFNKNSENNEENFTQSVESGIQSNVKKPLKKRYSVNDLNKEQKEMFNNMKKHGFPITLEDYIKDLAQQGVLK